MHKSTPLTSLARPVGAHGDEFDLVLQVALWGGAGLLSLFMPLAAMWLSWLLCVALATRHTWLLPAGVLVYAHSGAVVFASRTLLADSSDFAIYFDVFQAICSPAAPAADGWLAFGPEVGLSALYAALASAGACGLSINGLAYVQTLLVATLTLIPLCALGIRSVAPKHAALVVGGVLLMFSFYYATQLSRQVLSSTLVLVALIASLRRWQTTTLLVAATLFHLTAPLVYAIAQIARKGRTALAACLALAVGLALFADSLLTVLSEHADSISGLLKVGYYLANAESESSIGSDLRAVAYLALAGGATWLAARKSPGLRVEAHMLLAFALLGLALLPLPLASTRLTLALSAVGIGYYLFRGLSMLSRPLAALALMALLVVRLGPFQWSADPEHALWTFYPAASWVPGYYAAKF